MYNTRLFFRKSSKKGSKVLSIFQDQHMAANTLGAAEKHLQLQQYLSFLLAKKVYFSAQLSKNILNIFDLYRSLEVGIVFEWLKTLSSHH